jgi:hypothetical protein
LLGKLRHFLGESFLQGLANMEGRKVDINELTISLELYAGEAQAYTERVYPSGSG